jgi:hypothetical protein
MPRFVILRHETPPGRGRGLHWDLMLECGGVLRTWALAEEPEAGKSIAAEQLPDHRLDYLHYEGPVSQNRGTVSRWDNGEYKILEESPTQLTIALDGARLSATATLTKSDKSAGPRMYSLILT